MFEQPEGRPEVGERSGVREGKVRRYHRKKLARFLGRGRCREAGTDNRLVLYTPGKIGESQGAYGTTVHFRRKGYDTWSLLKQ